MYFVCFVCFMCVLCFVCFVCLVCFVCFVCSVCVVCFVFRFLCVFVCFWYFVCFQLPSETLLKIDAKTSQIFWYFVYFQFFKTTQNISQKRCQNLPKSSPRRSKIEVWRGSAKNTLLSSKFSAPGGGVLERPGDVLGSSWAHLGTVLGALGRLGSVLGLS